MKKNTKSTLSIQKPDVTSSINPCISNFFIWSFQIWI